MAKVIETRDLDPTPAPPVEGGGSDMAPPVEVAPVEVDTAAIVEVLLILDTTPVFNAEQAALLVRLGRAILATIQQ